MLIDVRSADFAWRAAYKLFLGFINPRPIALVSSIGPSGQLNLAPFSFYNMVSADPPVVVFSTSIRPDGGFKHTFDNIRTAGEFVIATVTADIARCAVDCAAELPREQSEFDFSGLTPQPAQVVRPPLVREAHVNIECRLRQVIDVGDSPGGGRVILGDVLIVHIDDAILTPNRDYIDPQKLPTVGRLGSAFYCNVTAPYELKIPPVSAPVPPSSY
jgi:flavin reductase (DIM6/NTAB) family NADH-FMN oxidoreductase RutF